MQLEFIDNNSTGDEAVRRRIRSHVAIGRNAGKKLARPSRRKALAGSTRRPLVAAPGLRVAEKVDKGAASADLEKHGRSDEEAAFIELQLEIAQTFSLTRPLWALELPSPQDAGRRGLVLRSML